MTLPVQLDLTRAETAHAEGADAQAAPAGDAEASAQAPATVVRTEPSRRGAGGPRRVLGQVRDSDVLALVGSALAGVAATWLLFTRLLPFSGALGWVVCAWVLFVAFYALAVSFDESGQAVVDRVVAVVVQSLALLLLATLVLVITYVLGRGVKALVHLNFFVEDLSRTGPVEPLTRGGIVHGIVGTLQQITVALVVTVPLGLTCAVYLNEFRGPYVRFVRTVVEAMTALPSIVAGLFVYATYILKLGMDKSGSAAALALSVMMLPIVVRAADVVIRLVPGNLKEASYALGAGQWRTVWTVTLPTARSGLATAVILGTARGIGETSPVLLTAGFAQGVNANPFDGPQVSLPLLAFELVKSPSAEMISRGFGAAATLLVLVLGLFVAARAIGGRGAGNLSPRQQRRRAAGSRADAERFVRRMRGRRPSPDFSRLLDGAPPRVSGDPAAAPADPAPSGRPAEQLS